MGASLLSEMFRFSLLVGAHAAAAWPECGNMTTPSSCIGEGDENAIQGCSWLVLSGKCEKFDGARAQESPSSCCASLAPDSHCKHTQSTMPDGACAVPLESGSAASFSLSHAKRMLHFAGAAYCDSSEVKSWSCGEHCDSVSGLEMITYIDHKFQVLAAFVAYDSTQNAVIVSFRGTVSTSIIDWINNLEYTKTSPWSKYPNAGVHHGFNDAWEDLKSDVMSAINNIRATHSTTNVQITGHSLGAAMAINAAMDIKLNYGLDTSVVDFGRPRSGDTGFAQALVSEGISTFRVTHHHDVVPHAPPEALGFYHSVREVYFADTSSSNYVVCDGSGEDSSCSNSCSPFSCTSVDDHLLYMGVTMGGNNCASSKDAMVV